MNIPASGLQYLYAKRCLLLNALKREKIVALDAGIKNFAYDSDVKVA